MAATACKYVHILNQIARICFILFYKWTALIRGQFEGCNLQEVSLHLLHIYNLLVYPTKGAIS